MKPQMFEWNYNYVTRHHSGEVTLNYSGRTEYQTLEENKRRAKLDRTFTR